MQLSRILELAGIEQIGKKALLVEAKESQPARDVKMTITMPLEAAGLKPKYKDDGSMITVSFSGDDVDAKLKKAMKEIRMLLKRLDPKIETLNNGNTLDIIYSDR